MPVLDGADIEKADWGPGEDGGVGGYECVFLGLVVIIQWQTGR